MKKFQSLVKRVLSGLIAVIMITMVMLNSAYIVVKADTTSNYAMIGTQEALNSPVLNSGFTSDNWNKWEMVAWGVFLSNFCVPFVDTYQTAFSSGSSEGSKGSGYKALVFGGGSDTGSTETIKSLADYAITQQSEAMPKTIYVSYSSVSNKGAEFNNLNTVLAQDTTAVAEELGEKATINDLLLVGQSYGTSFGTYLGDSYGTGGISSGELPTFWILEDGVFVKVLDYTDAYDVQLPGLALARAYKSDYFKEAKNNIEDWVDAEAQIGLDSFGNIVTYNGVNQYIIIPGAANQNLTTDNSINLVNSLVMNGYDRTIDSTDLRLKAQKVEDKLITDSVNGGKPIVNGKVSGLDKGSVVVYFSGETVAEQNLSGQIVTGNEVGTLTSLFDCSLGNQYPTQDNGSNNAGLSSNEYQFIMQPVGLKGEDFFKAGWFDSSGKQLQKGIEYLVFSANAFVNTLSKPTDTPTLIAVKTPNGNKMPLFGEPTAVAYRFGNGYTKGKMNRVAAVRNWYQMMYDVYRADYKSTHGDITSGEIKGFMDGSDTIKSLNEKLIRNGSGKVGGFLGAFYISNSNLYSMKEGNDKLADLDAKSSADFTKPADIVGDAVKAKYNTGANLIERQVGDTVDNAQMILAYPISELMMNVGNVLGIREGTQFSVYSTYIYMTYLDWYGITTRPETSDEVGEASNTKYTIGASSNFDTRIFTENSEILKCDINEIAKVKTEEDKQTELLEYTYLMTHPTEGRSYRAEIMNGWLTDFLYSTYQKLVYGNASDSYASSGFSGLSTSGSSSGFLSIDTYKENVLTSWFMDGYASIMVKLAGVLVIIIILFGLITRKKFTWFIVSVVVMINALLVIPSLGDITPYIANNMISEMFQDKMAYWAVSESVYNESIENEYRKNQTIVSAGSDSGVDYNQVGEIASGLKIIRDLSNLYTDRALMLKQDISQKVTEKLEGNYADIQNMQTTRWMLPTIMKQFSATTSVDIFNYVLEPLSDELLSTRNLYYWYKPDQNPRQDKLVGSADKEQTGGSDNMDDTDKGALEGAIDSYDDYVNVSAQISAQGSLIEYHSKAYDYHNEIMDMPHSIFYFLKHSNALPVSRKPYINAGRFDKESWEEYMYSAMANSSSGLRAGNTNVADTLEGMYNTYDSEDLTTMNQEYGYLWTTESPLTYMLCSVRDSFPSIANMSFIAGQLIGSFETYEVTDSTGAVLKDDMGNPKKAERRVSFMFAPETTATRDVLDLQEMFTNMIPYLYQMELTTCGLTGGDSGTLGDKKIENGIYEGSLQSWLFRSNWVTKLMENKDYATKGKVEDRDGNSYEVPNMLLPDTYPDERPMVFSEAQMESMGITEFDLNLVELKCVNTNKEVCEKWTYLANYINLSNMTKDIMFEQMALEATMTFNANFSPTGFTNGRYKMYPTTIDLRSLSFDSVMKMLILNSTKDASFVYGDTMKGLLTNSDIITAIMLLLTTLVNAVLIPMLRNFVLAAIFFMGLWAVIRSILADAKTQFNVSGGWFISNIIFLLLTLAFYAIFDAMAFINSADEVLTTNSIKMEAGSPIWVILLTLIAAIAYGFGMIKMLIFCTKNWRDMGMEAYASVARQAASRVSDSFSKVGGKLSSAFGAAGGAALAGAAYLGYDSASDGGRGKKEVTRGGKKGAGVSDKTGGSGSGSGSGSGGSGGSEDRSTESIKNREYNPYKDIKDDTGKSDDIDKAIERGKEAEVKEEKASKTSGTASQMQSREPDAQRGKSPSKGGSD